MAIYLVDEPRPHLDEGTLDMSMGRSLETAFEKAFADPEILQVTVDRVPGGYLAKVFGRYGVKRATRPTANEALLAAVYDMNKERL